MVLCMDYLIVFLNFEYLLNLDREILFSQGNKYSYFNYANQICYGWHKRDW